jgi:2-oxoglutarate ferredoxin oxidoreductase subunit alpha
VVENNDLGQMAQLLKMEYPDFANRIISVSHCDGLPLTARWIADSILEKEQK